MESDNKTTEKKRRKGKKDKGTKKGMWKKVLTVFLIVSLFVFAAGVGIVFAIIKTTPDIDFNIIDNLKESSKIYDDKGNFIENYSDEEVRNIVSINEIPKHLQEAFIAIEDERFRSHNGVDVKRVFGALWADIKTMSLAEGASTITQQLIKNYSLTSKKTFTRKIQEAYLALQIERVKSKDEILTAYLNTINLGGNKYGVQAASKFYFGKDVKDISLAESAVIAGITKNPSKYYPFSEKNIKDPKDYLDRAALVLNQMLKLNKISREEYDAAVKELKEKVPAEILAQQNIKKQTASYMKYQWFIEPAMDQVARDLAEKFGITEGEAKQSLRTQGYNIYLTIDQRIQQKTEDAINNYSKYPKIKDKYKSSQVSIYDKNIIEPQAAGVIIDVTNGYVKAMVGGRGPHPARSANRAIDIQRPLGSTMKPLGVYSPAIETKAAAPGTTINDAPLTEEVYRRLGWKGDPPGNYDGKYEGLMTLRNALRESRNIPAIKVWDMVGMNVSYDFVANKFHLGDHLVKTGDPNDKSTSALALGGMTHGSTPYRMAAAYSVFANNGVYSQPMFYTKVTDSKGQIVLEKKIEQSRSLSPEGNYIMTDLLKTVVNAGTGTGAKLGNMPAGGKTGTTNDYKDAWFAGFTPYYSGVFWIGNDDRNFSFNRETTTTGSMSGATVAPLWKEVMLEAHKGLPVKDFVKPENVVSAQVCMDSGKAPTELCQRDPRGSRVVTDLFIKGSEPIELCDVHVEARIDVKTGKLEGDNCPKEDLQTRVFLKAPADGVVDPANAPYILPVDKCQGPHSGTGTTNPPSDDEDEDEDAFGNNTTTR